MLEDIVERGVPLVGRGDASGALIARLEDRLDGWPGGLERAHVVLETDALDWETSAVSGISRKRLYEQPGFPDVMWLERWEPGIALGRVSYDDGAELFVIDGEFSDEFGSHPSGAWIRLPTGSSHRPRTEAGCTVYLKAAGLRSLRSAAAQQGDEDGR